MKVRIFELIDEKGNNFSLMDIKNNCIFKEPSNLGYGYTSEFQRLGNTYIEILRTLNQPQISGNLEFKNYDNYRKFIDFIEYANSLKWKCTIPYIEGEKTYYKNVSFQDIGKTDLFTENDKLIVPATFNCLSLWYEENSIEYKIESMEDEMVWDFCWDSIFNDSNSTSIDYKNEGHVEAPIELEIGGAVTNPKIEVYIDGKLYQQVPINTNILEYEKLLYDSRENAFKIIKVKTDGTEENLFDLDIIEFENDNVIRIPKNKACEIRLRADNTITSAKLTILPQYKCV